MKVKGSSSWQKRERPGSLTQQQREFIEKNCLSMSNEELQQALNAGKKTIQYHASRARRKLRSGAVRQCDLRSLLGISYVRLRDFTRVKPVAGMWRAEDMDSLIEDLWWMCSVDRAAPEYRAKILECAKGWVHTKDLASIGMPREVAVSLCNAGIGEHKGKYFRIPQDVVERYLRFKEERGLRDWRHRGYPGQHAAGFVQEVIRERYGKDSALHAVSEPVHEEREDAAGNVG